VEVAKPRPPTGVPLFDSALPSLIRHAQTTPTGAADTRDLPAHLAAVTDPRRPRGVRHALASLLAVSVAAVLARARSFTEIGEWAADTSQEVLAVP
jgi:DDE_Tnp_1-associated